MVIGGIMEKEDEKERRIVYQNSIGIVLAEGKENYYVRFPTRCAFIPKHETTEAWSSKYIKKTKQ